jgi:drug/metabolite transporter (DMT)-like permease
MISKLKLSSLSTKVNPNVLGIFWMLIAGLFFSAMVALIKLLGARFPSVEIVFFRSVIQLIFLLVILWRVGFSSLKTKSPWLQGLRSLLAVVLINCNFYAFTQLPIADVTAIGFSRNIFLAVLAVLVLGERLTAQRVLATVIGFFGILIIVRPESGIFEGAALVALAGAFLGAIMMVLIRKLTASDSNIAMMAYPSFVIVLITFFPVLLVWVAPTLKELGLLTAMSCLGILGQWCMIQAFRCGEAIVVAPAGYVRLVFASLIGISFFNEIPDGISLIGAIVIISSNLILIVQEGKGRKNEGVGRVPGDVT